MKKTKKAWIALLLGGLLLTTLAGAVWARPKERPAAHSTAHKLDKPKAHHAGFHYTVTIPGSAFHPEQDGLDWKTDWHYIEVKSGSGHFWAAVPMLPGKRTVESVILIVKDNSIADDACVRLWRLKTDGEFIGDVDSMVAICSDGVSAGEIHRIQYGTSPSTIWGGHGAHLELDIGGTNIYVYAVQIKYY